MTKSLCRPKWLRHKLILEIQIQIIKIQIIPIQVITIRVILIPVRMMLLARILKIQAQKVALTIQMSLSDRQMNSRMSNQFIQAWAFSFFSSTGLPSASAAFVTFLR